MEVSSKIDTCNVWDILQTQLNSAIGNKELYMVYQPQYNIKKDVVTTVEALLRWRNPKLGNVSPMNFIPIAEESGMIKEIGDFVIKESFQMLSRLNSAGNKDIKLAINISATQFYHDFFLEDLLLAIYETGVNSVDIELELTESILIKDREQSIKTIKRLKELGFKLAIDGFGVGYSSLTSLKYFMADTLKIDANFIRNMLTNVYDVKIVDAIINIGQSFGMRVVAEGIESAKQLELLMKKRCDTVQGYFLCLPLEEKELLTYLSYHVRESTHKGSLGRSS